MEQLLYKYCIRSLGEDFTDYDLCIPGDIIQIPGKLGMFEVLKCHNEGDVYVHNGEWGADPWCVQCRTLDKNGLSDSQGDIVEFYQKYKNNTIPTIKGMDYKHDIKYIAKKGGPQRKKLQDIFAEVEKDALVKEGEDVQQLIARENEIREGWLQRLQSENRNKVILEILEESLSQEQFGRHYVKMNGMVVLIDLTTDELMQDETTMTILKSQLSEGVELTLDAVKAGVVNRLKDLQAKLSKVND